MEECKFFKKLPEQLRNDLIQRVKINKILQAISIPNIDSSFANLCSLGDIKDQRFLNSIARSINLHLFIHSQSILLYSQLFNMIIDKLNQEISENSNNANLINLKENFIDSIFTMCQFSFLNDHNRTCAYFIGLLIQNGHIPISYMRVITNTFKDPVTTSDTAMGWVFFLFGCCRKLNEDDPSLLNYLFDTFESKITSFLKPAYSLFNELKEFRKTNFESIQNFKFDTKLPILNHAIQFDDSEFIQNYFSNPNNDVNMEYPISLFEPWCQKSSLYQFIEKPIRTIEMAALYGSVKCFKYLLLNGAKMDNCGPYAIGGGSVEIIRLVEQRKPFEIASLFQAVELHRYETFIWLFESKGFVSEENKNQSNNANNNNNSINNNSTNNNNNINDNNNNNNNSINNNNNNNSINKNNNSSINNSNRSSTINYDGNDSSNINSNGINYNNNDDSSCANSTSNNSITSNESKNAVVSGDNEKDDYDGGDREDDLSDTYDGFESGDNFDYGEVQFKLPIVRTNRTLLHSAAMSDSIECCVYILDRSLDDINVMNKFGFTPIMRAVANGSVEVAKILMSTDGIDLQERGNSNSSLLHLAVKKDDVEMVKLFSPFFDVNVTNSSNQTPIFIAALMNAIHCLRFFLENPKIDLSIRDNNMSLTCFVMAVFSRSLECAKILFDTNKFDVNDDKGQRTALSFAALNGDCEMMKFILSLEKVDVNKVDVNLLSPIFMAIDSANVECVKLLLKRPEIQLNNVNKLKETPLLYACSMLDRNGNQEEYIEIVKILVNQPGIKLNCRDAFGRTPLLVATAYDSAEIVSFLLKTPGVKIDAKEKVFFFNSYKIFYV